MYVIKKLRFRAMRTPLRKPLIWLRHCGLDPADVFIASFPRCGSHWMRFQLFEILTGRSSQFDEVDDLMPRVGVHHRAIDILPNGGRIIQTHELYRKEYRKAIYILRDPRDVAVSFYSWEQALGQHLYFDVDNFEDYLPLFLEGKVLACGSWQRHVESWLESPLAKEGNLLPVKYEEMKSDTRQTLAKIVDFLGFEVNPQVIENAIASNTVERMRAKEATSQKYIRLARNSGEESNFVRKGKVGGWKERLTPSQAELIVAQAGPMMERTGYLPSSETRLHGVSSQREDPMACVPQPNCF